MVEESYLPLDYTFSKEKKQELNCPFFKDFFVKKVEINIVDLCSRLKNSISVVCCNTQHYSLS